MPPPAFRVAITPKPFVGRPREYEVFNLGSSYFREGSQKTFLDALSFVNKHIIASLGKGALSAIVPILVALSSAAILIGTIVA
jgi:hypothetical protein